MVMEHLRSIWILGWALVRTFFANLFGNRRGLAAFEASYAAERLRAVSVEERAELAAMGKCLACGACDVGEAGRKAASGGVYRGVMDLMLASSRNMPDFDVAVRSFDAVGDDRLAELEKVCPARVPMRAVARFVRAKAIGRGPGRSL